MIDLDFLTSAEALLAQLADDDLSERRTLPLLTQLRKIYTPEQAAAALTLARLRQKAVDKFGTQAAQMFFTEDALQQASDPLVRRYRAQGMQGRRVLDVCCGIGADSLAFSEAGAAVLGLDIDPLRIAMARHNVPGAVFEVADVREYLPQEDYEVVFYDPARRDANGRRIYDVEQYLPPLSLVDRYHAPVKAVKLSPGVKLEQVQRYNAAVEFISVKGDLKEALLWFDAEKHPQATLLTDDASYHWSDEMPPPHKPLSAPRGWIVEPDPALIRAGLVQHIAALCEGFLLDETIAYFTTDAQPDSVWVRAWQVQDWMPFNLKKLKAYLREHDVGTVTVKKRGSPLTPEELISKLKLKGAQSRTLILTRFNGQPIVVICADYTYN